MSEIEKMYKNVGVTKIGIRKCTTTEYLDCQNYCFVSEKNKCDKFSYQYPPFTAEKQIELIKWVAQREPKIEIGYSSVCGYWVENQTDTRYYFGDKFDSALASLINGLWQSLSEEEKQHVKGILE